MTIRAPEVYTPKNAYMIEHGDYHLTDAEEKAITAALGRKTLP